MGTRMKMLCSTELAPGKPDKVLTRCPTQGHAHSSKLACVGRGRIPCVYNTKESSKNKQKHDKKQPSSPLRPLQQLLSTIFGFQTLIE